MKVTKRDGRVVEYESYKVNNAIKKAGFIPEEELKIIVDNITAAANKMEDNITVEQIQDLVENELMSSSYKDIAREYVRYRYKRNLIRENDKLNESVLAIVTHKNDAINQENSNKNPVINSTQRDYVAGEVSKDITMKLLLPDDIIEAHRKSIIHFHDADYFIQRMHNCCLVDIKSMLTDGTCISGTGIETPHSFSTACNIATQIMAQIASNQYGGQSETLSHLAPFVDVSRRKIRAEVERELEPIKDRFGTPEEYDEYLSDVTEQRVKTEIQRGVQTIQYQIMTLMTTNGQTPFVTVFMYLGEVPEGRTRDDLAMIIEEVLKQRYQGVKNEKGAWVTPAFPKLVYVLEPDNIEDGSKYYELTKLAAKCSAKRLVPDYVSEKKLLEYKYPTEKILPIKVRRDNWGDEHIWGKNIFAELTDDECDVLDSCVQDRIITTEVAEILNKYNIDENFVIPKAYPPMGCRSFLTPDYIHYKTYGRFNQGVVTINLVDVGLSAVTEVERTGADVYEVFWRIFDERLELCHRALQIRHQRLENTISDVSPIHWQHGGMSRLYKGETLDKLLHNNYSTLSLGYAGLYECVMAVTGKSHTDDEAKPFALSIMQHMNDKCAEWKKAEDVGYSLYGTPIESTTYKFATALKKRFGEVPGVTDHDYITNSYHVNVREKIDPFTKLKFESEFQVLSPGGAISYIETSNLDNNIEAVLEVMKYIYENVIYAELNTKSDYCLECDYDGEIKIVTDENTGRLVWECPNCGNRNQSKMSVARRTCGYIGTQFWNQGRTQEIQERFVHLGGSDL